MKIELLTPDFQGSLDSVRTIIDAKPDIFSHNIETVRRLYPSIRFRSDYTASFGLLKAAKGMDSQIFIKTGIMVGLGERKEEIAELMHHAVEAGVDILTIGQYLRPSIKHVEIQRYYHPEEFRELRDIGLDRADVGAVIKGGSPRTVEERIRAVTFDASMRS